MNGLQESTALYMVAIVFKDENPITSDHLKTETGYCGFLTAHVCMVRKPEIDIPFPD